MTTRLHCSSFLIPRRVRASRSRVWRRTPARLAALCTCILLFALPTANPAQPTQPPSPFTPRFRALALAESGGHRIPFTESAKPWLKKCGEEKGFALGDISNAATMNEALLAQHPLVRQWDFAPCGWNREAMAAFEAYIATGKGGWVGLHHAALLREFEGHPMGPWFSGSMGNLRYKGHIPTVAPAKVSVEDKSHPCMKDVPPSFVIANEEWYTWDRSPRPNAHVLASVEEDTYSPASDAEMGAHPVIWTNERLAARNVHIFMGHGPDLLEHQAFTTILRNAMPWALGT